MCEFSPCRCDQGDHGFSLPQNIRVLPTVDNIKTSLKTLFVWIVTLRALIMLLSRTLAPL